MVTSIFSDVLLLDLVEKIIWFMEHIVLLNNSTLEFVFYSRSLHLDSWALLLITLWLS